jgi:hypothetical protein
VDDVTDTCVSELTLDGPNDTVAEESVLEMVPPAVGETTVGGERPLPVFVVGSGGVPSVPEGVVELSPVVGVVALPPTSTVMVPVPEPELAVAVPAVLAGSPVPEVAVVPSEPPVVVVDGVVVVDVSCGSVLDCDVSVVVVVEPPVVVPVPDVSPVVAGGSGFVGVMLFRFGSGFAFVSVGGTVVVFEPVPVVVSVLPVVLVVVVFEPDAGVCVFEPDEDVVLFCGRVRPCCSWASAAATCGSTSDVEGTCCCVCCVCSVCCAGAASCGFGSGIGSGVVSGTAIAVSTPVESSYVGSCGSLPCCFGSARVV